MGKKDKVAVEFGESIDATDQLLETDLPSLKYEEVPVIAEDNDDIDDFTKLFNALTNNVKSDETASSGSTTTSTAPLASASYQIKPSSAHPDTYSLDEKAYVPSSETMSADDFVRNFLVIRGMTATLDSFQCEWYEQQAERISSGNPDAKIVEMPHIFSQNFELQQQVQLLRAQVDQSRVIADEARGTWARFKRERDSHRLHHRRLAQEKNALLTALARLRKHISDQKPVLQQLQTRYETASKEKMLLRGEKNKLQAQILELQAQLAQARGEPVVPTVATVRSPQQAMASTQASLAKRSDRLKAQEQPSEKTILPSLTASKVSVSASMFAAPPAEPLSARPAFQAAVLSHSFKAHKLGVSAMALSPVAPVLATASDDNTWKLFAVPSGDVIMTGTGHSAWLSAVSFSPSGAHLATASADNTVKLWSLAEQRAVHKLSHARAVWDAQYHASGNCIVTAAADNCARLWDVETGRHLRTYRGHTGTVCRSRWVSTNTEHASMKNGNGMPQLSQIFVTASADKTLSLWDARAGLCVQTLVGHRDVVTSVDTLGGAIVSSDASGVVKVWDLIANTERVSIDVGRGQAINTVAFDPSGTCFIAGGDTGRADVYSIMGKNELSHSNTAPSLTNVASDKAKSFYYGLLPEYGAEVELFTEFQTQDSKCINDIVIGRGLALGATGEGSVLVWEM